MPKQAKKKNAAQKASTKSTAAPKANAKPSARGTRYTPKQKAAVISYVEEVNAKKGRGGAAAASRKFKISQITIGQWIKKSGSSASVKKSVAKGATRGRPKSGAGFASKLRRLADLHEVIVKTEAELKSFQNEYAALKKSL